MLYVHPGHSRARNRGMKKAHAHAAFALAAPRTLYRLSINAFYPFVKSEDLPLYTKLFLRKTEKSSTKIPTIRLITDRNNDFT